MKIKNILYAPDFVKAFKKLPKEIQKKAVNKEKIFYENCFDASLKTHKLKGQMSGYWSFSINYSIRIIFCFEEDESVTFIDIGPHSIYY